METGRGFRNRESGGTADNRKRTASGRSSRGPGPFGAPSVLLTTAAERPIPPNACGRRGPRIANHFVFPYISSRVSAERNIAAEEVARQALGSLGSHGRVRLLNGPNLRARHGDGVRGSAVDSVELTGLEPVTSAMPWQRSSQLSYSPGSRRLPSVSASA